MIDSPRKRWLKNKPIAAKHRERMADPDFIKAVDAALLVLAKETTRDAPSFPNFAVERIAGAQRFVEILLTLSDEVEPAKEPERPGLNYRA